MQKPTNCANKNYNCLSCRFLSIVNKHAPLKTKIIQGNNAPFINKKFKKEIYKRIALENKYLKHPTNLNWELHKRQRNKCVKTRKKSMKEHITKITSNRIMTNKISWKTMRTFLTNKGLISGNEISLLEGEKLVNNESIVAVIINVSYVNVVEKLQE